MALSRAMSIKVKICGITRVEDALDAIELGADYLGFNFWPDSKRFVSHEKFREIIQEIPFEIAKVGVFVNADPQAVIDIATEYNLDMLQFHGDETPAYCKQFARPYMKAFRPQCIEDLEHVGEYGGECILIDSYVESAYGGTGIVSNWDLAREAKKYGNLFLSGGLTPDNVQLAIEAVKPYGVDVASGVETTPGVKDYRLMEEFIKKAKSLEN